tara:strand:- start:3458 stop:3676 length:219 start_codon:yes stop_codon:yes gene_type:complete
LVKTTRDLENQIPGLLKNFGLHIGKAGAKSSTIGQKDVDMLTATVTRILCVIRIRRQSNLDSRQQVSRLETP